MNPLDKEVAERRGYWQASNGQWIDPWGNALPIGEEPDAYSESLDLCAKLREGLTEEQREKYVDFFEQKYSPFSAVDGHVSIESYFAMLNAPGEEHVRAWLAATGP